MLNLPWEHQHNWVYNRRMSIASQHPCLERMGALLHYKRGNIASRVVRTMKFHRRLDLATWMGRLAVEQLRETGLFDGVECIVPIPLTRAREHYRGFNQALLMGEAMATELGIGVCNALQRIRETESQTHFRAAQRMENAKDIFRLTEVAQQLRGQSVMIVDDVMTTGRTMLSAIEELEKVPDIRLSTFAWAWVP